MYRINTVEDKSEMTVNPPFGPGFPKELADKADYMEVWGTSCSDPGPDYCEFRLFAKGEVIARQRMAGY